MSGFSGGGKGGGASGNTEADIGMANWAFGQNVQAIHNRYAQLGVGAATPGGPSAAQAAAAGTNLQYGGPSTMESQDIGTIATETGGAAGMRDALTGELFNPQMAAGLGPGGPISQLQQLAGQNQQQNANSQFTAGVNSVGV